MHICSSAKNPGVGGYNLLLLFSLAATYQAFLALAFPWAQETSATYTSSELPSGACSPDMQAALPPPEACAQGTFCTRIWRLFAQPNLCRFRAAREWFLLCAVFSGIPFSTDRPFSSHLNPQASTSPSGSQRHLPEGFVGLQAQRQQR